MAPANHDQGEFMKEDKQSGKKNQMEFLARVFTDRGPSQNRLFYRLVRPPAEEVK